MYVNPKNKAPFRRSSRTWKGRDDGFRVKYEKEVAVESSTLTAFPVASSRKQKNSLCSPNHVKKAVSVKKGVCAFRSKYMPQTPDDPITTPEDGKYALRRI